MYNIKTLGTYCVNCKENCKQNSSVKRFRQNRLLFANCAICAKKKSRFIKNQEAHRLKLH